MSCFWGHKWGKWENYLRTWEHIPADVHKYPAEMIGKGIPQAETRQKRECLTCGYAQDRFLRSGRDTPTA